MSQSYTPSPEAIAQLRETFSFVTHEREDVRKMALHGIAEHSKDNRDLWAFMSSPSDGPASVELLLQFLHAGSAAVLGDILTILINVSAEGSCAEVLVQHKVVRKAMRLLDGVDKSVRLPDVFVRTIQEMTFMLLSNLTASHASAIDDLLQRDDEDMRGFYLGKLQKYYEFLETPLQQGGGGDGGEDCGGDGGESSLPNANANKDEDDEGEEAAKEAAARRLAAADRRAHARRDLRKWILHILLNVTRTADGQELLLEDADWRVTLDGCLSSSDASSPAVHRLLAAQCFRNCAAAQTPFFDLLLQCRALITAVERLATRDERSREVQLCLAEFVASMLESEEGMARLESVNAKKMLVDSVAESRAMHEARELAAAAAVADADAVGGGGGGGVSAEALPSPSGAAPSASTSPPLQESYSGVDEVDGGTGDDGNTNDNSKDDDDAAVFADDIIGVAPPAAPPLSEEACTVLEKHVLPYLDDIIDAYLAPGSDEID